MKKTTCTFWHVLQRIFQCPDYDSNNNREINVKIHIKGYHPGLKPKGNSFKLGWKDESKTESDFTTEERKEEDCLVQASVDLASNVSEFSMI